MKMILGIFILLVFTGCNLTIMEEKTSLYLCAGQSNATKVWYKSIESEIHKTDSEAIVVWDNHPGMWIDKWIIKKVPSNFYYATINKINYWTDGIDYDLKAIFWFQGESDITWFKEKDYEGNFLAMIEQYEIDLNDNDFEVFTTLIYADDPIIDNFRDEIRDFRAYQKRIALKNNRIHFIDSKDYERQLGVEMWHLTEPESIRIGSDIAKQAIEVNNDKRRTH